MRYTPWPAIEGRCIPNDQRLLYGEWDSSWFPAIWRLRKRQWEIFPISVPQISFSPGKVDDFSQRSLKLSLVWGWCWKRSLNIFPQRIWPSIFPTGILIAGCWRFLDYTGIGYWCGLEHWWGRSPGYRAWWFWRGSGQLRGRRWWSFKVLVRVLTLIRWILILYWLPITCWLWLLLLPLACLCLCLGCPGRVLPLTTRLPVPGCHHNWGRKEKIKEKLQAMQ